VFRWDIISIVVADLDVVVVFSNAPGRLKNNDDGVLLLLDDDFLTAIILPDPTLLFALMPPLMTLP